jgi:GntR family transcriptional regulator
MRLWLSKSSEVPLREQLVTQIQLGIVSGDLKAQQKLPSTRELARRFSIHSNTVSAAYRELHRGHWVDFRKGSGVYVRERSAAQSLDKNAGLDQLIAKFFGTARVKGHSLREIQIRLQQWLALQPPDHFVVFEADAELREILVTEIRAALGVQALGADIADCKNAEMLTGAVPVAMFSQAEKVRAMLPLATELVVLRSRSVPESLQGQTRPSTDSLIAVVSRWPGFLKWSRTILIAAGISPDGLSLRDARTPGWKRGLSACALVIADSLTAALLPTGTEVRVFRLIHDSSLAELRQRLP